MTVTAYTFDELDESVQRKVIERWRNDDHFHWGDEWRDSLKRFAEAAPIRVRDWNVGYPGTFVSFEMVGEYADEVGDLSGVRAWKWLMNNGWNDLSTTSCPFTGYCGDESLLDAFRTAIANPASIVSLRKVFGDALHHWAKDFEADLDHWHSEECIREEIEANEYEFYDDGSLV